MQTITNDQLIDSLFAASDAIRYVAIYQNDQLISKQRSAIADASASESDKYEELFVNPTLLKIAGQRGRLDCGGLDYILIKYGHFYQLIREHGNGHISICIDKQANPIILEKTVAKILEHN